MRNDKVIIRDPKFPRGYAPEILTTSSTTEQLAGPFVQIQGHGGDCVLASAVCDGSGTDWTDVTIYDGMPIEGVFTDIDITSGELVAYKSRY